ncbi:OLC1v1031851C1 [Oldenlandia corymbosa var. corymbosa]|uniref:OLC1v1031851C1 n=1 Tax=Oldenlandia corymbosa var. corymbosa TaxID=529605 RepID=A0AAV1CMB1_OLDCO|nr:OLC1v1031851C1 [Oldenlandia corymbosa var. corymbosa]
MINLRFLFALSLITTFSSLAFAAQDDPDGKLFVSCLLKRDPTISNVIYTPKNTQFLTVLDFLIQNARWENPQTPKPKAILRPTNESHIQSAISCVQLVYKWQQIARKLPVDLTLDVEFRRIISAQTGNLTSYAEFLTAHHGSVDELVSIFDQFFPELNMTKDDCQEMPFIDAYPFLVDQTPKSVKDFLTTRGSPLGKPYFKWKVDFAQDTIPPEGISKIFDELEKVPPFTTQLGWSVFGGGIMDEIPESEIPFPHRGKLMIMRQIVYWNGNDTSSVAQSRVDWVRGVAEILGKYVPDNPRAQYADYRDHDLGVNNAFGRTSIQQARKWGVPYFKDNFDRLVKVKTLVDPTNFFKYEQSFPSLH